MLEELLLNGRYTALSYGLFYQKGNDVLFPAFVFVCVSEIHAERF
jgi:hypothetical protein